MESKILKNSSYISVEGIDGAGKTEVVNSIKQFLLSKGVKKENIVIVAEPGGTYIAEACRALAKEDHEEVMDKTTETLLMFSARFQLLKNIVEPSLKNNKYVISDRCYLSSLAYQFNDHDTVNFLCSKIMTTPDLIIYLDIEPEAGLRRSKHRGKLDRIEKKGIEYLSKVRKRYMEILPKFKNVITINASQPKDKVRNELEKSLSQIDL